MSFVDSLKVTFKILKPLRLNRSSVLLLTTGYLLEYMQPIVKTLKIVNFVDVNILSQQSYYKSH